MILFFRKQDVRYMTFADILCEAETTATCFLLFAERYVDPKLVRTPKLLSDLVSFSVIAVILRVFAIRA